MRKNVEGGSAIRAMFREGKEMAEKIGEDNVFDFSLGNPYTNAPEEFGSAIKSLIDTENSLALHGYTDNEGDALVREKIAASLNQQYGASYRKENIIMTVGAACALNIMLKSILDDGDEIVLLKPYFTEYRNYIGNYNGRFVEVDHDGNLLPDLGDFEEKITKKTKGVIINTPNNPSGVVYTGEILDKIGEILEKKQKEYKTDIYLISDEPYRELVYDGLKNPFVPDHYKNTVIAYSFSKSLSIPGERIGYLAISDEVGDSEMLTMACSVALRILGFVNAPSLIQKAVSMCLDAKTDVDYYDENRKLMYEGLTDMGFECIRPQGAFYIMLKTPTDEDEFIKKAKEHHILVVGAKGFGAPGYVRLAYCTDREKIKNSMKNFRELAQEVL